eukprot:TRINITY_DN16800_c0_g1_i1.p1 TRINITY_DN16800_c0_g1~~TRINITY_DN16800_c0_g1_i1.p1  ORF type:complete len:253 (-),score=71.15 TRINITY_DN16800_c0_g1_i1:41-706(-)
MTKNNFLIKNSETNQQKLLAREVLELGCILSVKQKDFVSFERNVSQVKAYYEENDLPESQRRWEILGLYLIGLLAQNKIGKFHTELELIPLDKHENIYISHPIKLEQYIMEGSYNKVFKSKSQVPADSYHIFMDKLLDTVREQIATCIEYAYEILTFEEAEKILITDSNQLKSIIEKRKWIVKEGKLIFKNEEPSANRKFIPSSQYIFTTINYAKELERII